MNFFLSWMLTVVFILLGSVAIYPIIRAALKITRSLQARRWKRVTRQRALQAWSQASSHTQLLLESSRQPHRLQLEGQIGNARVRIESFPHKDNDYTRITIHTALPKDHELFLIEAESGYHFIDSITRRNPEYMPQQMKRFDRNFMVLGNEILAHALLNEELRKRIEKLVTDTGLLHLRAGVLTFERQGLYESNEVLERTLQELQELTTTMVPVAHRLEACLLHNFRKDPDANIRLRNLKLLFQTFATSSEAKVAHQEMLLDPSPEVRLFGAMQIGEEGFSMIEAIAEEPETPQPLCIEAYKYLATQIKGQQSVYAVKVMLLLLHSTDLNSVAVLPIAQAIERYGAALDEETCLRLLVWDQHPRVAYAVNIAACRLLTRCGTAKAIGTLMQCETARHKELRQAAEKAILHIKTRLGHTEAGGLSLIEEEELGGALSGTEEDGALSFVEKIIQLNEEPALQDEP